jgi:hypothetical protein
MHRREKNSKTESKEGGEWDEIICARKLKMHALREAESS